MKEKSRIAVLLLLHVFFLNGLAQNTEIKFNLVEGNNAKPLGQINAITQDPNGYMWFSGQGKNCLYRYDGTRMNAFTHDSLNPNSLSGATHMETVYADNKGLIWIGFFISGLDQYNPGTGIFKHFINDPKDPSSLSAGSVNVVLRDHLGRLWVGTQNGLDRLDEKTGKFVHYRNESGNPSSLSCNIVRAIYEDRGGVLWIGTGYEYDNHNPSEGGLNRMEPGGTFTRFKHDPKNPNSLINNKVRAIFEDSRSNFWIGTAGDGLHTMDREKGLFTRHPYNPNHPEQLSRPALKEGGILDPITFIREDASGAIWIGTYFSGVSRYDTVTKKITHFESNNGYPDRSCFQSYTSLDGVLWLCSTDLSSFLYRVEPPVHTLNNIITGAPTNTIYEDKGGKLWAAGFLTGLLQYDHNKNLVRQFKSDSADSINLIYNQILSIFQNQQDTLWLCTFNGIILFNKINNHFTWYKYKNSPDSMQKNFDGKIVWQIIEDKEGLKWIATSEGLFHVNRENVLINQYLPVSRDVTAINSRLIASVLEDNTGDIWAGDYRGPDSTGVETGEGGINRLDKYTGRFRHYLVGIDIKKLFRDSKGTVWAGTGKGLYRYNEKLDRFYPFFDPQSESSGEAIVNMIEDDLNNLWVTTESSIVKLNGDRSKSFIYGKKFGIRTTTLQFGGICKTLKGEILIGNNNGFYTFFPNEMTETSKPLQLNITGFFINNHQFFSGKESPLVNPIENTSTISLDHYQNNFSFTFAAIDYRAPEANKYYTMLENYDSTWREAGGDKSAYYINVPPGKYLFRVRAINIDGVKAEKAIQVMISPPWWKTWWAYSIYGLLLLSAIIGIHRLQKQRTIRIERQKAQVKELAQAKEIEKAYGELKTTQAQLIQSEKMASLGELTAGIAHEIQNPLNFVNNFSEINRELLSEMKEELAKRNVEEATTVATQISDNEEKILHHGKRADAIVKSMLQHSQSGTGKKEPTDINALANEYLRLAYHGLRAKDSSFNATMKTDYDSSVSYIPIIAQDIGRVLLNLYNNAFYSVHERSKLKTEGYEPTVSAGTRKTGNKVEIRIKDNGNGIPQMLKDKIFQPFFTTKPTGQGTGLGLSLSYDIIKAHGGEIKVETKEGEFAEFLILLPISISM